jgi:hypothetical protein
MTTATMRLIEAVERLNMSGEIGDGMVANLHDLAAMARLERNPADVLQAYAERSGRTVPGYGRLRALADERVPRPVANVIVHRHVEPERGVIVVDGGRCRQCGCPR